MKKRGLLFLLMLVITFVSFACGGRNYANFEIPEGGYDGSEVEIVFYHTMSATTLQPTLEKYIGEFNKIYPNIKVKHSQVGGYDEVRDQINTELTQGKQPNLAYCYPDHVALYNVAGAVVNLDTLIESDIKVQGANGHEEILGLTQAQIDDFIEGYYNEGRSFELEGMYCLPFSKSTEVLYYNKTFFEANELSVPDHWFSNGENDTTSMEYVCAKIKEIDPTSCPLGYDSAANWFITMCEQLNSPYTSTEDHYLFNNDVNKDFVAKFRGWYKKGWVTTQDLFGAYTSGLFTTIAADEVKSYMSIGSSAGATHQRPDLVNEEYPFEVGIASIPQMDANNPKVISQGPSICIFKSDNPQEVLASWLFVKYLTTTPEFQAAFSMKSGYVPVIKSVANVATYKEFLENADGGDFVAALSAKVCLAQEKAYFTSPAFNGSSTARDYVGSIINSCLPHEDDATLMDKINKEFADAVTMCEYYE